MRKTKTKLLFWIKSWLVCSLMVFQAHFVQADISQELLATLKMIGLNEQEQAEVMAEFNGMDEATKAKEQNKTLAYVYHSLFQYVRGKNTVAKEVKEKSRIKRDGMTDYIDVKVALQVEAKGKTQEKINAFWSKKLSYFNPAVDKNGFKKLTYYFEIKLKPISIDETKMSYKIASCNLIIANKDKITLAGLERDASERIWDKTEIEALKIFNTAVAALQTETYSKPEDCHIPIGAACLKALEYIHDQTFEKYSKPLGMEAFQSMLDVVGFIPGVGDYADAANASIYVSKKEYQNAAFSSISLIPVAGDLAGKGIKYSLKFAEAKGLIKPIQRNFTSIDQAKKWILSIQGNISKGFVEAVKIADKGVLGIGKVVGNIWDDIILKGNKGVVEALSSQYKNIDEFLAGAEYSTKVKSDFVKYQARGGLSDLASYTAKHKVITQNRMIGKISEDVFKSFESGIKPRRAIQTSDGARRYVDNLLNGTAREIKSGRITLNGADFQRQVKIDIEIIAQSRSSDVSKIEWHALDGIDDNALKFIRDEMTKQGVSANSFKVVVY
jgi:hypothetical protein